MEEIGFGELTLVVGFFVLVVEIFVGVVLALLSVWLEYSLRKPKDTYELGTWWCIKWNWLWKEERASGDAWLAGVGTTYILALVAVGSVLYTGKALIVFLTLGAVLLITFGPRFIVDICRGLKYNPKTGDAEKIKELEKKIEKLSSGK